MTTPPAHGPSSATVDPFDVSVVIATRNRGQLLARALGSVLAQRGVRLQVLVVDDGSAPDDAHLVDAAVAAGSPVAQLLRLPGRPTGHGPSFARNTAAALAQGGLILGGQVGLSRGGCGGDDRQGGGAEAEGAA